MAFLLNDASPQTRMAAKQRLADSLFARSQDSAPIKHWSEGLAKVAQGYAGGRLQRKINEAGPAASNAPTDILPPSMRRQTEGGLPALPGKVKRGITGMFGGGGRGVFGGLFKGG